MDHDLAVLAERHRLGSEPAALAVLDLDDFKKVNDRHGHDAGDRVLVDLAELIRANTRRGDQFYRLGGEEFVLVLPDTDPAGLEVALDKLHSLVRSSLESPSGPVTVSIGGAVLGDGEAWADWLARADRALYRAKHAGRDRVEIAEG